MLVVVVKMNILKSLFFIVLLISFFMSLGCISKTGEQKNLSSNLTPDNRSGDGEPKTVGKTVPLFEEYTENLSQWSPQNRGEMRIQGGVETGYVREGSRSLRIDYTNNGTSKSNALQRAGIYLKGKVNLSSWGEYNAVSYWIFQPDIKTKARVYILLYEAENGMNFSVYEAKNEFNGSGWVNVVIPFSQFKWAEWSSLHRPFNFDRLNGLEISFDSDDPIKFTTYIDSLRPIRI
jgi:hypothetical protein